MESESPMGLALLSGSTLFRLMIKVVQESVVVAVWMCVFVWEYLLSSKAARSASDSAHPMSVLLLERQISPRWTPSRTSTPGFEVKQKRNESCSTAHTAYVCAIPALSCSQNCSKPRCGVRTGSQSVHSPAGNRTRLSALRCTTWHAC